MYDICLYRQIYMYEFRRIGVVCVNAADFGGSQENIFWLFLYEELSNCFLAGKIELGVSAGNQVSKTACLESAHDR